MTLASACGEDFDPASLIQSPRVLGARVDVVEANDDPPRAWPRRGETVELRWFVAFPDEAPALSSGFAACPAAPTRLGRPFCSDASELLPTRACERFTGLEPCVRLTVPGDVATEEVLVLGGICADGAPMVDFDTGAFSCEGGDDASGTPVTFTIRTAPSERPANRHPELAEVTLDGEPWPEPPASVAEIGTDGCPDDPAVREVAARASMDEERELDIVVRATESSFESFEEERDEEVVQETEDLLISHFVTAGEVDSQFAFAEPNDPTQAVAFTPPVAGEVPEGGRLVRFYFVIRDERGGQRGGFRAACVR